MTPPDSRALIPGHLTGTLTDKEAEQLYRASLNDPDLYAELMEMEGLREALAPAAVRQRLAAELGGRRGIFQRGFSALIGSRPAWIGTAILAAALALILIRPYVAGPARLGSTPARGRVDDELTALEHHKVEMGITDAIENRVFQLEPATRGSVSSQLLDHHDGAAYAAASTISVNVWSGSDSLVFAILRDENGHMQLLKTSSGTETAHLTAGSSINLTGKAGDSAGLGELRVVILPADRDLSVAGLDAASVLRTEIQVDPPGTRPQ